MYKLVNLVEFRDGKYEITGNFSDEVKKDICRHLDLEEGKKFNEVYGI